MGRSVLRFVSDSQNLNRQTGKRERDEVAVFKRRIGLRYGPEQAHGLNKGEIAPLTPATHMEVPAGGANAVRR